MVLAGVDYEPGAVILHACKTLKLEPFHPFVDGLGSHPEGHGRRLRSWRSSITSQAGPDGQTY